MDGSGAVLQHSAKAKKFTKGAASHARTWRALLPMVSVLAASCAISQRVHFAPPTFELEVIEITGLGISGGTLRLWLEVYNPNGYEIQGRNLEATITLGETHFGDALHQRGMVLPAQTKTRVPIDFAFTWSGVGAAARSLLARGSVMYDLEGAMRVDTPIGEQRVAVRTDGTVGIRDLVNR